MIEFQTNGSKSGLARAGRVSISSELAPKYGHRIDSVGAREKTFKKPKDLWLGCVVCEFQTNGSKSGPARAGRVSIWAEFAPKYGMRIDSVGAT